MTAGSLCVGSWGTAEAKVGEAEYDRSCEAVVLNGSSVWIVKWFRMLGCGEERMIVTQVRWWMEGINRKGGRWQMRRGGRERYSQMADLKGGGVFKWKSGKVVVFHFSFLGAGFWSVHLYSGLILITFGSEESVLSLEKGEYPISNPFCWYLMTRKSTEVSPLMISRWTGKQSDKTIRCYTHGFWEEPTFWIRKTKIQI